MRIHILSIFPESFNSYFNSSILKNAISKWLLDISYYKLNDYSLDKFKRVDDKAYGMHGQVIKAEVLSAWIEDIFAKVWKNIPVIFLSPSWDLLTQEKLENYYNELSQEFLIICGHYEWIDQRIIDKYVDFKISIWEYVLTSWELASMVFIDSLARLIPGVLSHNINLEEESFSLKLNRQKEYPVYTKPEIFLWMEVPSILLSWNHKEIEKWKLNNLT